MAFESQVWASLFQVYFRLSLVPLIWLPVVLIYGEREMWTATLLYWGALLVAYALVRRWPEQTRLWISFHLAVAAFTALFTVTASPENVIGLTAGDWRLAVTAFATVGLFALVTFSGWPGVAAGLALVLFMPWPTWESRLLFLAGALLALAAGLSVYVLIHRLDRLQRFIREAALKDTLTGLANRRALEDEFLRAQAVALREGMSFAVSLWDLDGLKAVNDRKGHAAGDAFITNFANVLREVAREGDALFRVGGDEFVGLHLGLQDGASLRERVRRRFAGVSVGFAQALDAPLREVLARADRAMYLDKRGKRGELEPRL